MVWTWTPATEATSATATGSGWLVSSPSDSSTTVAEPKKPMSTWAESLASACGSIVTGLPAMAPSDVTRAWPERRAAARLVKRSIAVSTSAWALVGAWTMTAPSPNATTPMRTSDGWRSTNARAAALAASMRVGLTSSACMLFETSKARITVPSRRGVCTSSWARAMPTTRRVRAGDEEGERHVAPHPHPSIAARSPRGPAAASAAARCARRRRDAT